MENSVQQISYSPVNTTLKPKNNEPKKFADNQVNMKELFSENELGDIVSRFSCLHKDMVGSDKKCDFDFVYLPTSEAVIIDNKNMTNDTVEINKDGKAISVGSWHRKELDGDYSDIQKEIKARLETNDKEKEAKVTAELDAMASLGKSQVAVNQNK